MPIMTTRGFSPTAEYLQSWERDIRQRQRNTVTFSRQPATEAVLEAFEQCSESDWDGEGAMAVEFDTYLTAVRLIEALPCGLPSPSVCAEPDGQINLEWFKHPRCVVSASVSHDGVIYWAALVGVNKQRGASHFIDDFPPEISQSIARVMV